MECFFCGERKNLVIQKYRPAEIEEIPNTWIMQVLILCNKCGWGFNCVGDIKKKENEREPPKIPEKSVWEKFKLWLKS